MTSKSTLVLVISLLIFSSAVFAGVSTANHETTGALNGPIYDWIADNDFSDYGLTQPASMYFSGGFRDSNEIIVRTGMAIIDASNEYESFEDLPSDFQEAIGNPEDMRQAIACSQEDGVYDPTNHNIDEEEGETPSDQAYECEDSATGKAAPSLAETYLGDVQSLGRLRDYTFPEPMRSDFQNDERDEYSPFDSESDVLDTSSQWEISRWNQMNSTYGWEDDVNKGNRKEVLLPEDEHFEDIADSDEGKSRQKYYNNPPKREENSIEISHNGNSWAAASGMELAIYSNDPSVWTHTHRYTNVPDGMEEFDEGKLFDRSYQQISDQGTLRVVYDQGVAGSAPSGHQVTVPDPEDGDTRWSYEGRDFTLEEFNVYLRSMSGNSGKQYELTDAIDVDRTGSNVAMINWDLEDSEHDLSHLAGERVRFTVESKYSVSYDKQVDEYVRVCENFIDDDTQGVEEGEGFCEEWDEGWEPDYENEDFISKTETYQTTQDYTFTDGVSMFKEDDDITVKKAKYPNGEYQYYVEFDQETEQGDVIGWNKIKAGPGETVQSQWRYFGSREKAWDDLYSHTTSTNGDKYVSASKPLRSHAYPAYEYYNQEDSTVNIIDPERAGLDMSERRPSPALVGHSTCVQNYPKEFSDVGAVPIGSYEKHEPCYWEIFAAGQDRVDPPISYYRLPYRVTNPGWLSSVPGLKDRQMSYEKYVFNNDLSSMLKDTSGQYSDDTSAYQKLYDGTYTHMNEVVFESDYNLNSVDVYGMVPESGARVEVDDTVKVEETEIDISVQPECEQIERGPFQYEECETRPVSNDSYEVYTVDITVSKIGENGNKIPIDTGERSGSLTVENVADYSEVSETGEDGTVTVVIEEPPEDSSDPLFNIQYEAEHWRNSSDPITSDSFVGDGQTAVSDETSWLLTASGIILVYWFMMLGFNNVILKGTNYEIRPVRDTVYENSSDITKKIIILGIGALIVFKAPENVYHVFIFIASLLLLMSSWD